MSYSERTVLLSTHSIKGSSQPMERPKTDSTICWASPPSFPWSFTWYLGLRGSECLHVYLWLMKDLSWTQKWIYPGYVFGSLALCWTCYLLFNSLYYRNINEVWTTVAQFFWLAASFWWMCGEWHDDLYPNDVPQYNKHVAEARTIVEIAFAWLAVFYLVIKPFRILKPSLESELAFDIPHLKPRYPINILFSTWREYENVHILFWLGKDYSWNLYIRPLWIAFIIPTVLIAWDFVWVSLFERDLIIDNAHYIAQLLWVVANVVWGLGDLYYVDNEIYFGLFSSDTGRLESTYWYTSWIILSAFVPIVAMYVLWFLKDLKSPRSKSEPAPGELTTALSTEIQDSSQSPLHSYTRDDLENNSSLAKS